MSDRLPLAAVWRGQDGLTLLDAGPRVTARMRGYCGDAAVDSSGALLGVSCPRGGLAVFWDLGTARVVGTVDLPDGCGLAPADAPGAFLLSSGRGGVVRVDPSGDRVTPPRRPSWPMPAGTTTSPSGHGARARLAEQGHPAGGSVRRRDRSCWPLERGEQASGPLALRRVRVSGHDPLKDGARARVARFAKSKGESIASVEPRPVERRFRQR